MRFRPSGRCSIHPHLHCLVTDGCFGQEGTFYRLPSLVDMDLLTDLFRHKVLRMLLSQGKVIEALVENLLSWPHSGFHVHQGERIEADDKTGGERVAAYIPGSGPGQALRAPLSQEKMVYQEKKGEVIYHSGKKGGEKKVFGALDWLAALTAHIPDRGEQMVRYYGWYSNKSRGIRKKAAQVGTEAPLVILPAPSAGQYRRHWAQLIQKVYEVDPLVCPKCQGEMRIISFIEDSPVIKKILVHLGLWEIPPRAPPRSSSASPPKGETVYDYSFFDTLVN